MGGHTEEQFDLSFAKNEVLGNLVADVDFFIETRFVKWTTKLLRLAGTVQKVKGRC